MEYWKLYEASSEYGSAKLPGIQTQPLRQNPTVVAVEFNDHTLPLDLVADAANNASLSPLIVTTSDFIHLIETALTSGLELASLDFSRELPGSDLAVVATTIERVNQGTGLDHLRSLMANFLKQRTIVTRATFSVKLAEAAASLAVHNNGIVTATGGKEILAAVDGPLSVLGRLSPVGV